MASLEGIPYSGVKVSLAWPDLFSFVLGAKKKDKRKRSGHTRLGKTLANQSFQGFGEENFGEFTIVTYSYFGESGVGLGKILANDIRFPKFFPARILCYTVLNFAVERTPVSVVVKLSQTCWSVKSCYL